jgi:hypothetical protein
MRSASAMIVRMSPLRAEPVDPRDQRWEVWTPAYRVCFWRSIGADAWSAREFEVTGSDVESVLAWAREEAADSESYQVFAVLERDGEIGVVRLLGADPTRS